MTEQSDDNQKRYVTLGATGAVLGALIGIAMRPTFMGVKIPLGVLTSSLPGDAPFKSELMTHLAIYLAAGAGIGCAIAYAVISVGKSAAVAPQGVTASQEAQKWQALVEFDPEIAAQAERVAAFGLPYADELAQKFLAIGDKAYLPQIADALVTRARATQEHQKAALSDRNNKFHGFRCFHDEHRRFVGEVSIESGEFHIFPSQTAFEEAVLVFLKFGRPSIASRATAPALYVAAAE